MTPQAIIAQSPIFSWLIAAPAFGAGIILFLPAGKTRIIRNTGMIFSLLAFALAVVSAGMFNWNAADTVQLQHTISWITVISSRYVVGADSMTIPLVILASGLGVTACVASKMIERQVKGYYVLLLLAIALSLGALVARDLLTFYIFCQLAMVPLYFLIGIWGGAKKELAAGKFFVYMLASGIILLIGILGLHSFAQGVTNGPEGVGQSALADHPFDLAALAHNRQLAGLFMPRSAVEQFFGAAETLRPTDGSHVIFGNTLFWLLVAGFGIMIPVAGVHTWLIDALAEAPTPVAMLMAGVTLGIGGYGLFRVVYPIFPYQAAQYWWWVALIGVISILYGALCALAQRDLKRLIAYASVSQMGFVLLGVAVLTPAAMHGGLVMLIAHGINIALLLFIAGVIDQRAHHCEIDRLGGLATQMPAHATFSAVGFFSAMGIPGCCGFVAQLLILYGTFTAAGIDPNESPLAQTAGHNTQLSLMIYAILAAGSCILTVGYLLWAFQRIFLGAPRPEHHHFSTLLRYERIVLIVLCTVTIALGIYPSPLLSRLPQFSHAAVQRADVPAN